MWQSRDRTSAIMLWIPRICWEYNAASWSMSVLASHLATASCAGWFVRKLALYSQPSALELSVKASIFLG